MSVQQVWSSIWQTQATPPTAVQIPSRNVDDPAALGQPIVPNKSYFQLTINELYLQSARKWFTTIDPMVVTLSEFNYDSAPIMVPYVVGPGQLKAPPGFSSEPAGMLFSNTKVAGLHPYAGGTVSFAVILCQVPIQNVGHSFLNVIEETSKAFDFSTMLTPYVALGKAVLSGVNSLLGLNAAKPLLGWRQSFSHDSPNPVVPGYFALIGRSDMSENELWVKKGRLYRGSSAAEAKPFRESDFVLFSLSQPQDGRRGDRNQLPFHQMWKKVIAEAHGTGDDARRSLQANFAALSQAISLSPDLTEPQAAEIIDEYYQNLVALRARLRGSVIRGGTEGISPELAFKTDQARHRSMRAFDLA